MVMNVHVAEDDATALRDVRVGERAETVGYFTDVLGRPPGRSEDPLSDGVKAGTTLVGSPDTVAAGIESLLAHSDGGFGGFMFRAHDWANREQTWRSYELFARYVMPRFQGSLDTVRASFEWAKANRSTIFGPNVAAIRKAYEDAGREVPEGFDARLTGAGALNPAK
jgi:limonene 1,2-monooxygenase